MNVDLGDVLKMGSLPRTEKKSMKSAEISMTLLLPTLVNPSRPAFSLPK